LRPSARRASLYRKRLHEFPVRKQTIVACEMRTQWYTTFMRSGVEPRRGACLIRKHFEDIVA